MEFFERKEFKYFVPMVFAESLRDRILAHMVHDPFCENRIENQYTVRSIYFDTPSLLMYFEKIEGLKLRKKLRVRVYNDFIDETPAFLEIKRKIRDTVFKERTTVGIDQVPKLLNGGQLTLMKDDQKSWKDSGVLNRFVYLTKRLKLAPKALITYEREAFLDPENPDLRVTFDYNVRSFFEPDVDEFFREEDLRTFGSPRFIMEVKFSIALPLWLRLIIREYRLHLQAISKYCSGVESWSDFERLIGYA